MIKLQPPTDLARSYFNFRCGEVLCVGPQSYNVSCALCGQKVPYERFPQHFRVEHLTDAEKEAEEKTETEDCKLFDAQAEIESEEQQLDAAVEVEPLAIKTEDDPIAHDESNVTNEHAHVDLAQIALFDQEDETDKDGVVKDVGAAEDLPDASTIGSRRSQRTAALKNMLVQQKEHSECEADRDWMTEDGSGSELNGHSDKDEHEDEEDDAKDMLFQCELCERAYNTKRSLQSHKRSKHNVRKPGKQQQTKSLSVSGTNVCTYDRGRNQRKGPVKVYQCDENECNQTFRTERDLRGHRWKHTGIFCDICGKPFTQSGNMMRHRQRHSGIKPYKCQQTDCDATFYTQKELTSHNICHTGRMPCICEICGRPCRDRGVLTAHMRRHTGERPAKCEVCGKAFYSFHDLNVHAVSHTNLRPFVCDVCGSTFQRKKALRVHKLLHSEQRKYSCKLCNKTFAQSGGLNAHMRTHESARARARAKAKVELATPAEIEIESISSDQAPQEAVTIELIQEEHASHVEVVAISAAGSWHLA